MLTVPLHMRYTAALADLHRAGLRIWLSDDGVLRWQLGQLAGYCADDQRLADVVASELAARDMQLFSLRVAVPAVPVAPQAGAATDTPPDELGPLPFEFDDSDTPPDDLTDAEVAEEHAEAARLAARTALDAAERAQVLHVEVQQAALRFIDTRQQIMDQLSLDRAVSGRLSNRAEQYATDAANSLDLARLAAANAATAARDSLDAVTRVQVAAGDAQQAAERAELADSSAFAEHRAVRQAAQRAGKFAADAEIQRVLVEQAGRSLRWLVVASWLAIPVAALAAWLAGRRSRVS